MRRGGRPTRKRRGGSARPAARKMRRGGRPRRMAHGGSHITTDSSSRGSPSLTVEFTGLDFSTSWVLVCSPLSTDLELFSTGVFVGARRLTCILFE